MLFTARDRILSSTSAPAGYESAGAETPLAHGTSPRVLSRGTPLLRYEKRSNSWLVKQPKQMREHLGNYIRAYRRKAGLSQRELAQVLGCDDEGPISRHERLSSVPPLLMAIGYSVVFRKPISELFAGLSEAVEQVVEERLSALELELKQSATKSSVVAVKRLEWLSDRRKPN